MRKFILNNLHLEVVKDDAGKEWDVNLYAKDDGAGILIKSAKFQHEDNAVKAFFRMVDEIEELIALT